MTVNGRLAPRLESGEAALKAGAAFMLVVRTIRYRNHTSLELNKIEFKAKTKWPVVKSSVELHGSVELEVAMGLLNNYRLRFAIIDLFGGPAVAVDAGEDEDELLRVIGKLQELGLIMGRKVVEQLLGKPTLENVKKFIVVLGKSPLKSARVSRF